jgi:hypothetical protein
VESFLMKQTVGRVLALAILAAALGGCAARSAYQKAERSGTSQAWNQYLAAYPEAGSRHDEAVRRRDQTLWDETVAADNAATYLAFIKKNKGHGMLAEAKQRLRALLAGAKGAESDYQEFFSFAPADVDDVRQGLEKMRFNALAANHDPEAYALFIAQYPGSEEAGRLVDPVRRADFKTAEKVGTRLAYQFFLQRYPSSSPEADKARARLDKSEAAITQQGGSVDVKKLLPRLRRASPALIRLECRSSLEAKIKRQSNLFSAAAESLRGRLRQVAGSGDNPPQLCAQQAVTASGADPQTVANAVRALANLMERQQALASLFDAPDRISRNAQEFGQRAAAMADDSETQELELEALYGNMPADPKNPDDTASRNAKEAGRRAKNAWDLARGLGDADKKNAAAAVLRMMDRQKDVLLRIIAYYEEPAAPRSEDPGVENP